MRYSSAVPSCVLLFLCWLPAAVSQTQIQNKQTPTSPHSAHKQQGFFDYVLGKVNPSGNDYGASVQAGRDAVVGHSIDDLYFWSNTVTLLLLSGVSATVLLEWRSTGKKEAITASLIAQLWNGRVSDRIELERRTEQFNQFVATHNAEVEKALSLTSQSSEQEKEAAHKLNKNVRSLVEKETATGNKDASPEPAMNGMTSAASPAASTASLQQSNLLLQRRVEAMQNSEQNLKQRLNQMTLLLDQERRRNATLKGA